MVQFPTCLVQTKELVIRGSELVGNNLERFTNVQQDCAVCTPASYCTYVTRRPVNERHIHSSAQVLVCTKISRRRQNRFKPVIYCTSSGFPCPWLAPGLLV